MVKKLDKAKARAKRHQRVRNKINGTADCPRLNVFRSSKHIYKRRNTLQRFLNVQGL